MAVARFDGVPEPVFHKFLEFVSTREKKILRLVSKRVKYLVEQEKNSPIQVQYWTFNKKQFNKLTKDDWMDFSSEVEQIIGIDFECRIDVHSLDLRMFLKQILKQHPELMNISMRLRFPAQETMGDVVVELKDIFRFTGDKLKRLSLDLVECKHIRNRGLVKIINSTGGQLVSLTLMDIFLSGEQFEVKEGLLNQLKSLIIQGCDNLTNKGLVKILKSTGGQLEHLQINESWLSGKEIDVGDKLKQLKSLDLYYCRYLTDEGLENLINSTGGQLLKLSISNCTDIYGENFHVNDKLERLQFLDVTSCCPLFDEGLLKVINSTGGKLEHLSMSHFHTYEKQFEVGRNKLKGLKYLDLSTSVLLSNDFILKIIRCTGGQLNHLDISRTKISAVRSGINLTQLRVLNLNNCDQLTDTGLVDILNITSGQLVKLFLKKTRLTGENFDVKADKLQCLQYLNLSECGCLTNDGLVKIVNSTGGHLVELHLGGGIHKGMEVQDLELLGIDGSLLRKVTLIK